MCADKFSGAKPGGFSGAKPGGFRELAIQAAGTKLDDQIRAKIKDRLRMNAPSSDKKALKRFQRAEYPELKHRTVEGIAVAKEINAEKRGVGKAVPPALLTASLRAADVLMPEALEQRIVNITTMHLDGFKPHEIAETLDLPIEAVRGAIKQADLARKVVMAQNPDMALAVVEGQMDVILETKNLIMSSTSVLQMVATEMGWDHAQRQEYEAKKRDGTLEKEEDPDARKARKGGIAPMKLQAFAGLIDSIGKQQDRMAHLLGLLDKHIPEGTVNLTQINQNIQFSSDKLNDFANAFMQQQGFVPITEAPMPQPAQMTVTVEATPVEDDDQ